MNERATEYWNKDAEKYRQLADLLRAIAEQHCSAPIDDTTHNRWREVMALMTEVDAYIDERLVPGINTEDDIVEELESFDRFRGRYPHITPEALGEKTWRQLESAARETVGHFQVLAAVTTYDEYVEYRTKEAIATVSLFNVCATDDVKSNVEFNEKFIPTLEQMSISACMFDSANDLVDDYKEGKASLQPSLLHRVRLLREALTGGLPQMNILRHHEVRREVGRAALLHIGRHAQIGRARQAKSL